MEDLNFSYKFKRFIRDYGNQLESELKSIVRSKLSDNKSLYLRITDLDNLCDYIIENRMYSEGFYSDLIKYCKQLVKGCGYYVDFYDEGLEDLDDLGFLDSYSSPEFKPMLCVFKTEKDFKNHRRLGNAAVVTGALIGLMTLFTES